MAVDEYPCFGVREGTLEERGGFRKMSCELCKGEVVEGDLSVVDGMGEFGGDGYKALHGGKDMGDFE